MIVSFLVVGVIGLFGGYAFGAVSAGAAARRRAPKYPCPWDHCSYPLSETPLVTFEGYYQMAKYHPEGCPGCDRRVIWDGIRRGYLRHAGES
jgi:hypothetical protein